MDDRTTVASPPDDGGHHGTFSFPEDEAMVRPPGGGAMPPMSTDATFTHTVERDEDPPRGFGPVTGTFLLALISVALVLLAMMAG